MLDGVTSIGYYSLAFCYSLRKVNLPSTITTIGDYSFYDCSSLCEITLPSSVTSLGEFAFCDTGIQYVVIPDSVISIGAQAFKNLLGIQFGDGLEYISEEAIKYNGNMHAYCYQYSIADIWLQDRGYRQDHIHYLDDDVYALFVEVPDEVILQNGSDYQIPVKRFPECAFLSFESSDESVAVVSEHGLLHVNNYGEAVITVSSGDVKSSLRVIAYNTAIEDIILQSEVWRCVGESFTIPLLLTPLDADEPIRWSSADTSRIHITDDGLIMTRAVGDAIIVVSTLDGRIIKETILHISYPVLSITLNQSSVNGHVGDSFQLIATVTTRNDSFINKLVYFSSSDDGIASISEDGVITLNNIGRAVITASSASGVTAICEVTVACVEHTIVVDPAVEPTCVEPGFTEGSHCSECGEIIIPQETIPALGHDLIHHEGREATCTENGWLEYDTCSRCEYSSFIEIPALGHDWSEPVYEWASDYSSVTATVVCQNDNDHMATETVETSCSGTEATCETDGLEIYTAVFSNSLFTTQVKSVEIPATGHDWGDPVFVWGEDNSVTASVTCKNDPAHVYGLLVIVTFGERVEPTCEEPGYQLFIATAEFNGQTYTSTKKSIISPEGHDWNDPTYEWAYNNESVTAEHRCNRGHVDTETVSAHYALTRSATCEEEGLGIWTSDPFVNEAFTIQTKEVTIPALGHDWEFKGFTWAEDFSTATAIFTCKNDESHFENLTATVTTKTTAATCEAAGKIVYTATATFEGETYSEVKEVAIPAIGHEYGEPTYTWADDYSEVTAKMVCTNDANHVVSETVSTASEITKAASCEEKGETTYTATFVNEAFATQTKTIANIDALGHNYGEPTYIWADDYSNATAKMVCVNDATHVVEETVSTTSEITKAATCEEKGETTYTATFTNAAFTTQTKTLANIDALGHDWGDPTYTWADDNKSVTAKHICKHDGDHAETETVAVTFSVKTPATCEGEGVGLWTSAEFENKSFAVQTKEVLIPALGHTSGEAVIENNMDPTCTEEGHYDLVVYCTVCYKELSRETVTVDALGHEWGTPIFNWNGYESATATRTCERDAEHSETVECVITSEVTEEPTATTEGIRTYTATATFSDNTTATNTKEEVIPALGWTWTRFAGANRYDTAALAAKEGYADHSCATIIVASGQSFPDALAGSALAGVYECPILLTSATKLSDGAMAEIQRLAADDCTVLILGGIGTVSEKVEASIKKLGVKTERVAGSNREATAVAVYEKGREAGGFKEGGTVIIATGYSFADVLSMSPYAYASKTPIILGKKDGSLSKDTKALLKQGGFTKAIIIGGTGSVSEASENYLKNTLGMAVMRIQGNNRYETSGAIMKWELGLDSGAEIQPEVTMMMEGTGVATGASFPDALGSVSLLGKMHSPLLLVSDSNKTNREATQSNIAELIAPNARKMSLGYIFGGPGTVSEQIEEWLNDAVK